jgi:hypothetical protein
VAFITSLKSVAPAEVVVDIDWGGFSANIPDTQDLSSEGYGLPNLIKALEEACVDDLGKEAVKAGLKKVVVKPSQRDAARLVFADGVIEWHASFGSSSFGLHLGRHDEVDHRSGPVTPNQ